MRDIDIIREIEKLLGYKLNEGYDFEFFQGTDNCYIIINEKVTALSIDHNKDLSMKFTKLMILCKELEQLEELALIGNGLYNIEDIAKVKQLKICYLNNNHIRDLSAVNELKQLTGLYAFNNEVNDISLIKELEQLEILFLSNNDIDDITAIGELKQLSRLNLGYNKIKDISPLQNLEKLSYLQLEDNEINNISLKILNRFSNVIVDLNEFGHDYNDAIYLGGNPIINPPLEILKQGKEATIRYLDRKEKEAFSDIKEAKLIFVGDGDSGKTSLKLRLYDPNAPLPTGDNRTRGIEISQWNFEDDFTAHMWDFGGQDVYYPVHRFFITENALFVLLSSTRIEQHNFEYWIPTIHQFGGESPILIGQTCHEGNKMPWNDLSIYTSNPLFNIIKNRTLAYHSINLKDNNEGLNEIKQAIIYQIKNLPHCCKPVPLSWVEVREALRVEGLFCIQFSRFREICQNINPESFATDNDHIDCCRFLHEIGSVFWYHKNDLLRDWVILKPELAVEAVYILIDDKEIKNGFGHISPESFIRLWANIQYRDYHNVLKEMLKEFKVAFPKQHNDKEYIMPALLESMPEEKNWTEEQCITAEYEYNFMPRALVNQLSAELSRYILLNDEDAKEEVWNNAVNLVSESNTICQIKEDFYNRKTAVKACGKDARAMLMIVMGALNTIVASYRGVEYEISIPCICDECKSGGEHITKFEYKKLIRLHNEKQRKSVFCNESGLTITIDALLYNLGFTNVLAEGKGDKKMSKKIKIFLASSSELEVERKEMEIYINRQNKALYDQGIFLHLEIWEDFLDAMSNTRLQDEYNKAVEDSDIFISLFFTKAGKFTEEEFDVAYKNFKVTGKPYVYVFMKNANINIGDIKKEDMMGMFDFKEKLIALGHYPTIYADKNDLKLQFKSQLDKLLADRKI